MTSLALTTALPVPARLARYRGVGRQALRDSREGFGIILMRDVRTLKPARLSSRGDRERG